MSKSLEYRAFLAIILSLAAPSYAAPSLTFPVNSQLPPVAYTSQAYEFTFLPTTFTSDVKPLSYTLRNNPSWLSINSSSRRLAGTPTTLDIGAPSFEIVASDDTAYAVCSVTLVVLDKKIISVEKAVVPQSTKAGSISPPSDLLLHAQETFSFTFALDTFDGISATTRFYAVLSDRSPLPNWIQFDPLSMQFSGIAPPLLGNTPDKQAYSFNLAASNVIGFSEADAQFQIIIQKSVLAFIPPHLDIKVSRGRSVRTSPLIEQLKLDGNTVTRSDLNSIEAGAPAWLSLDSTQTFLSGTAPNDVQNDTFFVTVTDNDKNAANMTIRLQVTDDSDEVPVDLGAFTVTAGTQFAYPIQIPTGTEMNSVTNVKLENAPQWLSISSRDLVLSGSIPNGTVPYPLTLSIKFGNTTGVTHGILTMNVVPQVSASTRVTSNILTPTNTATDTRSNVGQAAQDRNTVIAIVVTVVTLTVVMFLAGLAGWCVRRRRNKKVQSLEPGTMRPNPTISLPISRSATTTPSPTGTAVNPEKSRKGSSAQPPRIELPWSTDSIRGARRRLSKRRRTTHSSIIGPSWDDLIMLPVFNSNVKQVPNLLMNDVPEEDGTQAMSPMQSERPAEQKTITFVADSALGGICYQNRVSKTPSTACHDVIGLPKRLSGAGHGAGIYNQTRNAACRSSWQTTLEDIPMNNSRAGSVLLESFPIPPSRNTVVQMEPRPVRPPVKPGQPTLRIVHSASNHSDDFETARQRFHTEKARLQLEGSDRYAISGGSRTPPKSRISRGLSRSPLQTLSESGDLSHGKDNQPFWSHWNNIGAGAINRMSTTPRSLVRRDTSMASSRQFDSAVSSDSQWEDEDLVADENAAGERYWQNAGSETGGKPSPRLPFEPQQLEQSEITAGSNNVLGHSKPRLVEQRKHFGVEGAEFQRSQRSHRGSFRFV